MLTARSVLAALALFTLAAPSPALAQAAQPANAMSFFISSVGSGRGANLGGLLGADKHCQTLAAAVGAGSKTWQAYLSQNGAAGIHPASTRRIASAPVPGTTPRACASPAASPSCTATRTTSRRRRRSPRRARSSTAAATSPNRHDILTGTQADGTAYAEHRFRQHDVRQLGALLPGLREAARRPS